ncbi:MAG: outer membrane protein assembly factor [Bacteroidota bacterium]|nr:outer membrane protein assembly factor [Bacteroidota bacterium]
MKQLSFLTLAILSIPVTALAQLGDFQLSDYNSDTTRRRFAAQQANPELKGGLFKHLFVGKNYRKEWRTPVQAPVLNFRTDMGGLKPKDEGGGRQTHSLDLEDAKGRKWVLRSVRKYPFDVVEPALQGTIAEKIVADGISASYPYSVLSVGTLARAAGVPYLPNTLVYIPDDAALDSFRSKYRNTISFLELRTIDTTNIEAKSLNTHEVMPKLFRSGENGVLQRKVLKARLLDNFVMDFDRHADQWEWTKLDSAGRTFYYPIPKDRDQAFFKAKGLLPKIGRFFQPTLGTLQGFRAKAANIKTFNFVARDFDRTFLNELTEETWNTEIDNLLSSFTDGVIEEAIRRQPVEMQSLQAKEIGETLKEKRQYFKKEMQTYYRFLSRTVAVRGSHETELFTITTNADNTTLVQVAQLDSAGQSKYITYQRLFDPSVTKELQLYGLEGNDRFLVRGGKSHIRLRFIGGSGNDHFQNESNGTKARVYDVSYEANTQTGSGLRNKIGSDPLTNEYRRLGFQYPITLPGIGIELTREGGLFLGPTLKIMRPGFRKEPYGSQHFLYATRAINSSSYHFRYNADFIGIAKKLDFLIRGEATLPTVRSYFFGLGNNTVYNKTIDRSYYLASYQQVDAALQVRYSPATWLQFTGGPVLQYLKMETDRNKDRYVNTVYPEGSSLNGLRAGQVFGGGEVRMLIDLRNHPTLTTQGMHLNLYAKTLHSLDKNDDALDQLGGNISLYTDFIKKRIIVLATSFGADRNFGKFVFPQAQYLGFRQNLRGYRFQRFAGRARFYNNSEVRINLGVRNFYFFKGPVGLIGFNDIGRVWMNNENSDRWHKGHGWGVWLAPFGKVVVMGTMTTSEEEKKWLQVSFGFQF